MNFEIIEKLGEGKRGEVYKIRLQNNKLAAVKFSKNYDNQKEWEILNYLNGCYAPKPLFRTKNHIIMELIEGKPLKHFEKTPLFYEILKLSLKAAFYLDEKGVFHKQLGRYYHIINTSKGIKFLDFERAIFTKTPRNFFQIVGYYLNRDEFFDKNKIEKILKTKKSKKEMLFEILKVIDESKYKAFY